MFSNVGTGHTHILLILAVDDFGHALSQKPRLVLGEQNIPIATPHDLDHIPARTAEDRFEFLNDLAVATNRAVESLQVAVHDEDEVVEFFARGERDRTERFGLIAFAVAEERPHFLAGRILQTAIIQVLVKAGLVDRHNGAETHRYGWVFPKIWHEPWVRIAAESTAGLQFLPKVFEFALGQTPFKKCSGVHTRRRVPLEVNQITRISRFTTSTEKVIEGDFIEGCAASKGADVATDRPSDQSSMAVRFLVGANHHGHSVPTNDALDSAFGLSIARISWLFVGRNCIDIGCIGLDRNFDTITASSIL